ncbi:MAG: hypothetical protein GWN71_35525, partial [Gammaproteobacteria bacterium]|nr:hypothetical protein [Gemmatimonadota bacterium]NIU78675.1 hypothetical protein [Gammaproteobacteria bacterium]NIY11879.1 hypothetical protein [Gemmatimonadota bacterium]
NLHLYSAKVSAVGMYAFVVGCFLTSDMPDLFGWLAFAAAVVAVVEGLLCQILSDDIDETAGSLLRVLRRARPPA